MKLGYSKDQMMKTVYDMDRFMLKKGETARIVLLDEEIFLEFTHYIGDAPEGVKGYYVCIGDPVKMVEGQEMVPDVGNCPFCAGSQENDVISGPRRRFVTNILQYVTNLKGAFIGGEINGMVKAWLFGNDKYNELAMKKEQWGSFRNHDLMILCEVEKYQNFKMEICPEAVWKKNEDVAKRIASIFKKERFSDLDQLLGRRVSKERMQKIAQTLGVSVGVSVQEEVPTGGEVSAEDLLKDEPQTTQEKEAPVIESEGAKEVASKEVKNTDLDKLLDI